MGGALRRPAAALGPVGDVTSLHGRVERRSRPQPPELESQRPDRGTRPRAQGVNDPEIAQALAERDRALEARARTLAEQAVESGERWAERLGTLPTAPSRRKRWIRELSTVSAYHDRCHITGQSPIGFSPVSNPLFGWYWVDAGLSCGRRLDITAGHRLRRTPRTPLLPT